jgi:hypothetical protein
MRGVYSIPFLAQASASAIDWFEINTGSGVPIEITGIEVGNGSDAGDAQDEQIAWFIKSAHSTSGSGGASTTPVKTSTADAAASATAETANTTQATGGSPVTHHAGAFNVRGGLFYKPLPEERLEFAGSTRVVVGMNAAPTDSITWSGTLYFRERP